jgi:hypothetical protein
MGPQAREQNLNTEVETEINCVDVCVENVADGLWCAWTIE